MTITFLAPDGVAVTAQQERQARAVFYGGGSGRPLGARSGFRVGTDPASLSATSTTWTLLPCSVMIDPGASTHQGGYPWSSDANVTGAVTASDATYDRKDIVYIQVNDSSAGDGSGALTALPIYAAGTPSASPVAPTLPARSFLVGTITVPKTGGGSPTVILNPARFVAAGGILPIWSQPEFDALVPHEALTVRRMDLPETPLDVYRSGAWALDLRGRGQLANISDSTTSTGLSGTGVMANAVTVSLIAGRNYRAVYVFDCRSAEASLGVLGSFRTSAVGDTSTAGTARSFDRTIYTSARTSSWGTCRVEATWQHGFTETVALKIVLARNVGSSSYDISSRVLYVEEVAG